MNERIRQLASQARNYALDEKQIYERIHNTEQCMEEYREVYNEKFAQLIVRECLNIAHQEHKNALEFEWDNDDTAQTIRDSISEHFGVEE